MSFNKDVLRQFQRIERVKICLLIQSTMPIEKYIKGKVVDIVLHLLTSATHKQKRTVSRSLRKSMLSMLK